VKDQLSVEINKLKFNITPKWEMHATHQHHQEEMEEKMAKMETMYNEAHEMLQKMTQEREIIKREFYSTHSKPPLTFKSFRKR
jgi:hypothetical protein